MGKSQRTKGHSYERFTAQKMREIGYPEARRHLEYQDGEANGIDIANTGQFAVQCKAMKNQPNLPKVFGELKNKEDEIPVVVFKVDRKGEYACFKLEDALMLMQAFKQTFKE